MNNQISNLIGLGLYTLPEAFLYSGVPTQKLSRWIFGTLILLSPKFQNTRPFHKIRAIIYLWPDIIRAFDSPKGTRFQIISADAKYEKFRFVEKST
jgi:hypothetical protein